ncbi:MAG: hypothetical protein V9E84_03325 [Trichococcus flocculiformis]
MVKIGEKTVVSVTCQDVILQLAEQYCSEGEYLHFGMKENPEKICIGDRRKNIPDQIQSDG